MIKRGSLFFGSMAAMLLSAACSKSPETPDSPQAQKAEITFSISVLTRARSGEVIVPGEGDALGVYLCDEITPGSSVSYRRAVCSDGIWRGDWAWTLSKGESCYLFAVHPYEVTVGKFDAVPIEIASQRDYLCSVGRARVSFERPSTTLAMRHLLGLISLDILPIGYPGKGVLQQIRIEGDFPLRGNFDVVTRSIRISESGDFACDSDCRIGTDPKPGFFVFPQSVAKGNLTLVLRIDGRDYTVPFPEMTVRSGCRYHFPMVLSRNELTLFADRIDELPIDSDTPSDPAGYGALRVTHRAASLVAPMLTADTPLSGVYSWGDGTQQPYREGVVHDYRDGAPSHTLVLTHSGARSVLFYDLEAIDSIDFSKF